MSTFVSDAFTDTAETLLSSHTGATGASWTKHPNAAGDAEISNANRARHREDAGGAGAAIYYASGVPPSADYSVEAVVRVVSDLGSAQVLGRVATGAQTYYAAVVSAAGDSITLFKLVAGTATQLGLTYSVAIGAGTDWTIRLQMVGSSIKVFVNGTERISATDSDITAAGRVGVLFGGAGALSAFGNTLNCHIDSINAIELPTPVPGGALADGVATRGAATMTAGGADAQGLAPAPKASLVIGGASGDGVPLAGSLAGVGAGGASGDGVAPTGSLAGVSSGGANAGGYETSGATSTTAGGATADGVDIVPTSGSTPSPGAALAGGNGTGGSTTLASGSAEAAGRETTSSTPLSLGGATAGTVSPTSSPGASPSPGAATATGNAPHAVVALVIGSASANGIALGTAAGIAPGGALADGFPPLVRLRRASVTTGDRPVARVTSDAQPVGTTSSAENPTSVEVSNG